MDWRDIFRTGDDDRPPAPDEADPADVEQYTAKFLEHNEIEAASSNGGGDPEQAPFAKAHDALDDDVKHRSEFPWLFDPDRGVRWDFDPIELRNLGQANTWVGMLVQTISKEIAETSWTIERVEDRTETQKRLSTHPEERTPISKDLPDETAADIFDLLADPNPDDDWQDLVEMVMGDLLEVGSLTAVKAFDRSAYADEEFVADAETVEPRAIMPSAPEVWTKDYREKAGIIDGYWQFENRSTPGSGHTDSSNTARRGRRNPTFFDRHEIVWSDMTPRTNRRYGIPPTLIVRDHLRSLDLAVTQEQQYLSRGSIPSGAWVFEQWDREEVTEWKRENEENVKGKPHKSLMFAGRGGDVRFEPMSMNFQELEFTDRMKWYARVVASAFQVPTAVVGIEPERVNYNTFQGERENFESNTLGPYLQKLERAINDQIINPHWGRDYRFEFMPGMSESTRDMISSRVRSEFNANIRTRNEARREVGLEAVDDADDGFKDDIVEDAGGEGPFGDVEMSADAKANGAAVEFPNAGGPAFDSRATLINFCDDLAQVCDGGVFVGDGQYPDEMRGNGEGDPVRAVGINESKAYAVWSHYRDEAVALSDPHAVDEARDAVEQTDEDDGIGDGDSGGTSDTETAAKAEYEVGDETVTISPPDQMVNAAEAALDAAERGLGEGCGTGVGTRRAGQIIDDAVGPDVIDEIAAYLTSHEEDVTAEGPPTDWSDDEFDDCGNLQYAKWGGVGDGSMKEWAQGKANRVADARGEELPYPTVEQSASTGGSGNADGGPVSKDEPLRETDEWYLFDVQPGEVESLTDAIADDVADLYDAVLTDEEVQATIERLAAADDEETTQASATTEKTLSALSRRLRDLVEDLDIASRIEDALAGQTAAEVADTVADAMADAPDDVDDDAVDVEAIRERLADRSVEFADTFAERMADDIRETVGDGWAEGKNSREIAQDIADQADIAEGWTGAERIARQELQIASGEARSAVADELDKVEVWETAGDDRVREAHQAMDGTWKRPGEQWEVDYSDRDRGVQKESVPGDSEPGIGCRCVTLLRDIETVDDSDHAGV